MKRIELRYVGDDLDAERFHRIADGAVVHHSPQSWKKSVANERGRRARLPRLLYQRLQVHLDDVVGVFRFSEFGYGRIPFDYIVLITKTTTKNQLLFNVASTVYSNKVRILQGYAASLLVLRR